MQVTIIFTIIVVLMIYLWNTKAEDSKTGRVQRSLLISFDHMVTMPECRNGLRPDERK